MNEPTEPLQRMIFVHSDLDLYGLDPYEFRLYAHIARRGKCYSSLKTLAKICKMSVRKAQYGLKALESFGLIEKQIRKGKTDIYQLTLRNQWKEPQKIQELEAERKKVKETLAAKKPASKISPDEIEF